MHDLKLQIQTADPVHVQITRLLREKILSGQLSPAERLPSTDEMARLWHVNRSSVIKAMTRLMAEGLIERRQKRGTFVKADDKRGIIGILVGPRLLDETSYFHRTLCRHLQSQINEKNNTRFTCRIYDGFYDVAGFDNIQSTPVYRQLKDDLNHYPFKGFVHVLAGMNSRQVANLNFNLPVAGLGPCSPEIVPDVIMDYYRFTHDAVKQFAQRGFRKIVYLRAIYSDINATADLEGLRDAARELNLPEIAVHQCKARELNGLSLECTVHDEMLALIGMWQKTNEWPDALLVSDDIATRAVALALVRKGVEVPGKLFVMTLANEGVEHYYGVPVERYEFSLHFMAAELLRVLWQRMMGETPNDLPIRVSRDESNMKETSNIQLSTLNVQRIGSCPVG